MLFNSQEDTDSYNLIDFYRWRILVIEDGGYLSLQKHPGSDAADDSGIAVTEDKPYLMTVVRKAGLGVYGDDYDFQWTLEDLSSGGTRRGREITEVGQACSALVLADIRTRVSRLGRSS